jgi:hypothetical protein
VPLFNSIWPTKEPEGPLLIAPGQEVGLSRLFENGNKLSGSDDLHLVNLFENQ